MSSPSTPRRKRARALDPSEAWPFPHCNSPDDDPTTQAPLSTSVPSTPGAPSSDRARLAPAQLSEQAVRDAIADLNKDADPRVVADGLHAKAWRLPYQGRWYSVQAVLQEVWRKDGMTDRNDQALQRPTAAVPERRWLKRLEALKFPPARKLSVKATRDAAHELSADARDDANDPYVLWLDEQAFSFTALVRAARGGVSATGSYLAATSAPTVTARELGFDVLPRGLRPVPRSADATGSMPGPDAIDREAVRAAIRWWDAMPALQVRRQSSKYDLWWEGHGPFPVKAICMLVVHGAPPGALRLPRPGPGTGDWPERRASPRNRRCRSHEPRPNAFGWPLPGTMRGTLPAGRGHQWSLARLPERGSGRGRRLGPFLQRRPGSLVVRLELRGHALRCGGAGEVTG